MWIYCFVAETILSSYIIYFGFRDWLLTNWTKQTKEAAKKYESITLNTEIIITTMATETKLFNNLTWKKKTSYSTYFGF